MSRCDRTGIDLSDSMTRIIRPDICIHQKPREGKDGKWQRWFASCLECDHYNKED